MIMTKSPFKDIDDAFEPMFNENIAITHCCQRTVVEVAVFTNITGDALTDDAIDTDREDITIVCKRKDWPFVSNLSRGDLIERVDFMCKKYRMSEVKYDVMIGWCIQARSI